MSDAATREGRESFASPAFDPDRYRGSDLHREMVEIAFPGSSGRSRQGRRRGADRFHRAKLAHIGTRRQFAGRLANYALYRLQRQRKVEVGYFPVVLSVESSGACNLRCPGCVTGLQLPAGGRKGAARLETLREIIDEAYPRAMQIQFHRQGEPLLSPNFFAACAYAFERGLWTVAHSNLSFELPDLARRVVAAGLCNLVVSCDGATQETYGLYRRRGDLERVLENVREIVAHRRATGARFPWVSLKFVIFDHNWHEIRDYRKRAEAAGADDVVFVSGFSGSIYHSGCAASEREFDLHTLSWRPRQIPPVCLDLWDGIGIDYDGAILPCCYAYSDDHMFVTPEQAREQSVMQRWNSEAYRAMRAYFLGRPSLRREQLPGACGTCEYTRPQSS